MIDWASFHGVFQRVQGFPSFFSGRNLDAWSDCMTFLILEIED